MSLCKFAFPFSIRLPSITLALPVLKLPWFSLSIPDLGIDISISISLPSISLALPILKLPWFFLTLDFGFGWILNFSISISLPSISLALPVLKLPWITLPPCPLDLVE